MVTPRSATKSQLWLLESRDRSKKQIHPLPQDKTCFSRPTASKKSLSEKGGGSLTEAITPYLMREQYMDKLLGLGKTAKIIKNL